MDMVVSTGEPLRVTQAAADTSLQGPYLIGVLCSTSTGGTLTIADTLPTGARTVVSAMPLQAGGWYTIPFRLIGAVTITIGNTADVTVCHVKG